jgi:hypothetical protein
MNSGERGTEERIEVLRRADIQDDFGSTGDGPRHLYRSIAMEERFCRLRNEGTSGIGKLYLLRVAVKQALPNPILKFLNLLGERRLGNSQPRGGTGDVQLLSDDNCRSQKP